MDRKGAEMNPQGLFQKFCAGSCTRIKAYNSGKSGKYLGGRENQHTLRLNGIKSEEEKGVTNGSQISSFRDWVRLPWQTLQKNPKTWVVGTRNQS